jgi:multidrug efflux pump subunit AcrB
MHLLATDVSNAVIRDVAQVRDGYRQSYSVRSNGLRAALLTVLKNGKASTLDIINNDNNVKATLRGIMEGLPPSLEVKQLFDQSVFVRASGGPL